MTPALLTAAGAWLALCLFNTLCRDGYRCREEI